VESPGAFNRTVLGFLEEAAAPARAAS
jgi:hypothetical protein